MTFKELRKRERWSRTALAKKLGIDQSTIAQWEYGRAMPRWQTLSKLQEIFNLSKEELISAIEACGGSREARR